MSFQDTWSDDVDEQPWEPRPGLPDPVIRHEVSRADRWWFAGVIAVIIGVGILILTLAILGATGQLGPGFTERCAKAGG